VRQLGAQTDQPIDLQEFSELKRLHIRSDFLLMSEYERDVRGFYAEQGNAKSIPYLTDVLPPSLKQLRLELDGEYKAYHDSSCQAISGAFYELMDQLEALAVNKLQPFPRSKGVVFEEAPHSNDFRTHRGLGGSERGTLVRAAFADAEIDLRCWRSKESWREFTT